MTENPVASSLYTAQRLASVLDGVIYPARTWQLLAQADYYGADHRTRTELARLPADMYPSLNAVLVVLNQMHRPRPR